MILGRTPYTPKTKKLRKADSPQKTQTISQALKNMSGGSQSKAVKGMVCPNCKLDFPEGFNFCGKCGGKTEEKLDVNKKQRTEKKTRKSPPSISRSIREASQRVEKEFNSPLPVHESRSPSRSKTSTPSSSQSKSSQKKSSQKSNQKMFLFSGITDGKTRSSLAKKSIQLGANVIG